LRVIKKRLGCVICKSVISYISWDLITPVIKLTTFRADNISARALGKMGQTAHAAFFFITPKPRVE